MEISEVVVIILIFHYLIIISKKKIYLIIYFLFYSIFSYLQLLSALLPISESDINEYEMVSEDVRGITFLFNAFFKSQQKMITNVLIVKKY